MYSTESGGSCGIGPGPVPDGSYVGSRVEAMKNIVLIGISGSGKTSMGRRLAKRLSREFVDLDSLIQQREGLSISKIFEERGEEGFRLAETEAIRAVSDSRNA